MKSFIKYILYFAAIHHFIGIFLPTINIILPHPLLTAIYEFIIVIAYAELFTDIVKFLLFRREASLAKNIVTGFNNIKIIIISIAFFFSLFSAFGIDWRSLLTSLTIVAAAIAITFKDFLNDFIVGLYFSFSENFKIGDSIKFKNHHGKIVDIGVSKVKIINDDDEILLIPNTSLYREEVINSSQKNIQLMNINFEIDLDRINSLEELEQELKTELLEFKDYIESDSYDLRIIEMKRNYLELKFQYTLKQFDRNMQRNIRKKTVRKIFNYISLSSVKKPKKKESL